MSACRSWLAMPLPTPPERTPFVPLQRCSPPPKHNPPTSASETIPVQAREGFPSLLSNTSSGHPPVKRLFDCFQLTGSADGHLFLYLLIAVTPEIRVVGQLDRDSRGGSLVP